MYTQALNSGGGVAQRLNQHFNTNKLGLASNQVNLIHCSEIARQRKTNLGC